MFSTNGRSSRNKFWLIAMPCILVLVLFPFIVIFSLPKVISIVSLAPGGFIVYGIAGLAGILLSVFIVGLYFTTLVKRFHDRNKSGWWALINFIPYIGLLWIIIECGFLKGTTGPNSFGADPLAISPAPLA